MPVMPNEYLTTSQAAKICDVTRFTILNWIKKGKLLAVSTLGGHQRIPREAILVLLKKESQSIKQEPTEPGTDSPDVSCLESKEITSADPKYLARDYPQRKKVLKRMEQNAVAESSNVLMSAKKDKINEFFRERFYLSGKHFASAKKTFFKIFT